MCVSIGKGGEGQGLQFYLGSQVLHSCTAVLEAGLGCGLLAGIRHLRPLLVPSLRQSNTLAFSV